MVEIEDLMEYNVIVRRRYYEKLAQLPWEEFERDRGASFGSIRDIFVHTLSAIDHWLDFLTKENLHPHKAYNEYQTFEQVRDYMHHVEERMSNFLHSLPTDGLNKLHNLDGRELSTEDVLIHVFEEEVHHRGELIALLWQMEVPPPPMGWKGL